MKTAYTETVWIDPKKRKHHRCRACLICPNCPAGKEHRLEDFVIGSTICKGCNKKVCTACQKQVEQHLIQTNRHSSVILCHACLDKGCSMRDPALYTCQECDRTLGTKQYDQKHLNNFKHRPYKNQFNCKACATTISRRLKKLQRLVSSSARVCKCKRQPASGMHLESCLTSDAEQLGRWSGSDKGVTLDDFKFIGQQSGLPDWWRRALGFPTRKRRTLSPPTKK